MAEPGPGEEKDLKPGFCDPIQITDKAYNDSAIWADFTKDDKPRHFRLGVFGALKSWNPENLPTDRNSVFLKRLVVVKRGLYHANKPRAKPFKYGRPSPGLSATLFAPGTVRRGNDGALWAVRRAVNGTQRWVPA